MAIIRDSVTNVATNTSDSVTFSHTCAGDNRLLFVGFLHATSDEVVSVTYGGVAMTQIAKANRTSPISVWIYLYYLVAPTSGANDVVISFSTSKLNYYGAVSYKNCRQISTISDSDSVINNTNVTSVTTTVTTTNVNNAAISFSVDSIGDGVAGTGSAVLNYNGGIGLWESNPLIIAAAGNVSMEVTHSSGTNAMIMASFEPFRGITGTETVTLTETVTKTIVAELTEIITLSEPYLNLKKFWKNLTKNVSSWLNQDKS